MPETSLQGAIRALVSRRKALGLRQADIAELIGVGQQHVSWIERGKGEPPLSTLQRYARVVGARLKIEVVEDEEQVLAAAQQRIAELEAENARLRSALPPASPEAYGHR